MKRFTRFFNYLKFGSGGLLLLLTLLSVEQVNGQQAKRRVYATGTTNNHGLLGSVSEADNAKDGNVNTASTLNIAVIGGIGQSVRFPSSITNKQVHVKIGSGTELLSLLPTIRVQAYNGGDGDGVLGPDNRVGAAQVIQGSSLLHLLSGTNTYEYIYTPPAGQAFDRIRVTFSAIVVGATSIKFYDAYYEEPATVNIACDTPVDLLSGSTGSLLSGLTTTVVDPSNAVNGNEADFASISTVASAANYSYLQVLYPGTSKAGDSVRVLLEDPANLITLGLLDDIGIRTYNGSTLIDDNTNAQLLHLQLLSGSTKGWVSFATSGAFDRIEIRVGGLLNVLGSLKVYEVQRIAAPPTINLGVNNRISVYQSQTLPTITATSAGNNISWYLNNSNTPLSGSPSLSPSNLPVTTIAAAGSYLYSASTSRTGCTNGSAKAPVYITVLPTPTFTNPSSVIAGVTYANADRRIVVAGQSGNNYTFSNPSNVPAGLTLNANGNITGSPTGTYPVGPTTVNFTANVTDATLSLPVATARQFSIVVYPALTSNAGTFPNGVANTAYGISAVPAPAGGSGTYSYALQSGSLPTGLQVSNTGVISGTPTTAGTYNFTIKVTDTVTGQSVDHSYTNVVIYSTLVANTATLPNGIETVAYGATAIPAPTGGSGPFEYTLSSGELPAGLGLTLQGGITGTPTADGVYNFTITVSNPTSGQSVQQTYSNVVIYEKLVENSATLPNTNVGINPYPATAVPVPSGGSGVTAGYIYSVTGSVPTGVTISPSGAISGAPTTVGTFAFTVTITDPTTPSQSVIQSYTVEIGEGLVANNTPLPNSYVGISPYPATSVPVPSGGSGEVANYTYTTSGNLPTGVTINQQGVISGNPTAAGTYQFSVLVNDPATGLSVTQSYEVIIGPALVANAGTLPSSFVDGTYSSTIPVPTGGSGATGDYVYTTSGAVPPGLEVSGSGSVTGSPTTAGTFSFSVSINDPASGLSVSQPYSLVISPKLLLPGGVYPTAYVNQTSYSQPISVAAIENGSTNGSAIGGIVGGALTYSLTPPVVNGRILALPTGFDLAPDGTLSGDPSAAGISTNTFTVYVTDGQQVASNDYTLIVESSLPVKLASFKVAKEGDVAQLLWSTTSESNSASFEVQRSRDGKEWKAIGSRDAKGESAAIVTYNFTDANPFDGENLYRLKMIDKDATFALSTIQSVSFAIESLKLYPNPVANSEPLNIQVKDWGLVKTVKVFNALGKVVFESAGDVKSVVSTEQLTAGLYVVQVTRKDGQVVSSKFVKR